MGTVLLESRINQKEITFEYITGYKYLVNDIRFFIFFGQMASRALRMMVEPAGATWAPKVFVFMSTFRFQDRQWRLAICQTLREHALDDSNRFFPSDL